jgi:formylglycine-generating enzyme required for sulfatase activity
MRFFYWVALVCGLTGCDVGLKNFSGDPSSQFIRKPVAVATLKDCPECPELIAIPAGTFLMGTRADMQSADSIAANEQPQHSVTVPAFALGKFEVTQAQWYAVMGTTPSRFQGSTLPVEKVSWAEAQAFVQKLSQKTGKSYRLPTEAEWEYAARAGTQTEYSFGDDPRQLSRYAWHSANSANTTHPVGTKLPNAFGLYDMSGNVWEWNNDVYGAYSSGSAVDPVGASSGSTRVLRGGSWYVVASAVGVAERSGSSSAVYDFGFRLVRSVP